LNATVQPRHWRKKSANGRTKARIIETYIKDIAASPQAISEFDERVWAAAIDRVTVQADGGLLFCFRDGSEIAG